MRITLEHEGETFTIENEAVTAKAVVGSFARLMRAAGWGSRSIDEATGNILDDDDAWRS